MGALSSDMLSRMRGPRCGSTSCIRTASETGVIKLKGVSGGGDCTGEGGFTLSSSGMGDWAVAPTIGFGSSDNLPKWSLLSDEVESGRERLSLAAIAAGDILPVPRRIGTTLLLFVSESQLRLSVRRFDLKSFGEREDVEDTESPVT